MSIDFARAKLLMETIVEAGKHGPVFQHIASEAGKELRELIDKAKGVTDPRPKVVTPPAGPASGAVQFPDGHRESILDPQLALQRNAEKPETAPAYDPGVDLRQEPAYEGETIIDRRL